MIAEKVNLSVRVSQRFAREMAGTLVLSDSLIRVPNHSHEDVMSLLVGDYSVFRNNEALQHVFKTV